MKQSISKFGITVGLVSITSLGLSGVAGAITAPASTRATSNSTTSNQSASDSARLKVIITKGDQEINRRLKTLATLSSKVNGATKLSTSDKATLSDEVSSEISDLTALKTKLDSDTVVADAKTDAQSIFTDYRVYALIVPKVELVRAADDQQVSEAKLTTLAGKLQTRIDEVKSKGKDVSALQSKLDDLNSQVSNAKAISSSIESKVIGLQPSDYNNDHSILSGDAAQLKTAHSDNQAALADAKAIVAGLKSL